MQELFYIVCLAVGFALGWYMKREKVPAETVERMKRIEEANRERQADLAAFVTRMADIREGLESICERDPVVYSRTTDLYVENSQRESMLHDKIEELEREIERASERWCIPL